MEATPGEMNQARIDAEASVRRHEALQAVTAEIVQLAVEITRTTDLSNTDVANCLTDAAKYVKNYR